MKGTLLYDLDRLKDSILAYCTALRMGLKDKDILSGLDRSLDKYVALNWKEISKSGLLSSLLGPSLKGEHIPCLREVRTSYCTQVNNTCVEFTCTGSC